MMAEQKIEYWMKAEGNQKEIYQKACQLKNDWVLYAPFSSQVFERKGKGKVDFQWDTTSSSVTAYAFPIRATIFFCF